MTVTPSAVQSSALGCAHLLSHLRCFRSRGKSRALPLPHLRCTRLLVSCFWAPRDACHIFSCDTARFQLVCWRVDSAHMSPTWSASSLPHFEGAVCYGCNRATAPDATPLNYGDWLPAGAVSMHCHACHWCDPSSARLSIAIARQLSQSFSVDSVVVIASALVQ